VAGHAGPSLQIHHKFVIPQHRLPQGMEASIKGFLMSEKCRLPDWVLRWQDAVAWFFGTAVKAESAVEMTLPGGRSPRGSLGHEMHVRLRKYRLQSVYAVHISSLL
jgi:hypothetical protein